jgi:hypothetical protein
MNNRSSELAMDQLAAEADRDDHAGKYDGIHLVRLRSPASKSSTMTDASGW